MIETNKTSQTVTTRNSTVGNSPISNGANTKGGEASANGSVVNTSSTRQTTNVSIQTLIDQFLLFHFVDFVDKLEFI